MSSGGIIPATLPPINYYNIGEIKTTRNFTLTMNMSGMNMHLINGLTFELNRIDWETPLNSLEEWRIINASNMLHPMHSHSEQFQVYSRNGSTNLAPEDKGWKDTVLINPFETVRLLVKFTDYRGIFLFHCHNLEHEDDGMMQNFKIVDPIGINEEAGNIPEEFRLYQNYPNPFNPVTNIKFDLPKSGNISLKVYNQFGREVTTLANGYRTAGSYEISFDADTLKLSSGVYFYKLITEKKSMTKRMILIK